AWVIASEIGWDPSAKVGNKVDEEVGTIVSSAVKVGGGVAKVTWVKEEDEKGEEKHRSNMAPSTCLLPLEIEKAT
ncbi:hypothetical protein B296_00013114, partial [Ensete ventricosum]